MTNYINFDMLRYMLKNYRGTRKEMELVQSLGYTLDTECKEETITVVRCHECANAIQKDGIYYCLANDGKARLGDFFCADGETYKEA